MLTMMARDHHYYTYLLANRIGGTIYVGVTNDLARRISDHRSGVAFNFTDTHKVHRLVWFEFLTDIEEAIKREIRTKK